MSTLRRRRQFIEALHGDVADVQGGTTSEGIHLAAMAGTIDVLQRCFADVETRDDVLWLNPCWPDSLGKMQLPIVYHGHVITLTVLDHTVLVHSGPGSVPPVRVGWSGQVHELSAEQTLVFPLQQMAAMAQEG